jgi:hypothetical protein
VGENAHEKFVTGAGQRLLRLVGVTVVLVSVHCGSAMAISGLAGDVSAAQAQYPDLPLAKASRSPNLLTLRSLTATARDFGGFGTNPHMPVRTQRHARALLSRVNSVVKRSTHFARRADWYPLTAGITDPATSSSILLLLAGIGVLLLGTLVRWRRGAG